MFKELENKLKEAQDRWKKIDDIAIKLKEEKAKEDVDIVREVGYISDIMLLLVDQFSPLKNIPDFSNGDLSNDISSFFDKLNSGGKK